MWVRENRIQLRTGVLATPEPPEFCSHSIGSLCHAPHCRPSSRHGFNNAVLFLSIKDTHPLHAMSKCPHGTPLWRCEQ